MKVLLLAAGLGTRLRPITDTIPKCLVPIRGKPLMGYWFDMLLLAGVERILVNTHYLPESVRDFVAGSPWRNQVDMVHEEFLLGTAGTLLQNRKWFEDRCLMMAHADNLTRFDVRAFIDAHNSRPAQSAITMMTFDTDAPRSCGIVECDEFGIVRVFHEKVENPPGCRANAAVYILEPEVIQFIAGLKREVVDFSTEVLPAFVGRIFTFHNTEYHRDIGTLESLALAEKEFARQ